MDPLVTISPSLASTMTPDADKVVMPFVSCDQIKIKKRVGVICSERCRIF